MSAQQLIASALRLTGVALSIWAALSMLSLLAGTPEPTWGGRSPYLVSYAFRLLVGIVLLVLPHEIVGSVMSTKSRGDWSETPELLRPGIVLFGLIILYRGTADIILRSYKLAEYNSSHAYPLQMDCFLATQFAAKALALVLACLFIFKGGAIARLIRCASRMVEERVREGYGAESPTLLPTRFAVSPEATGATDSRGRTEDMNKNHPPERRSQMPDETVRAAFEQMKDQVLLATAAFFMGEYPPEGQALLGEVAASRGFDESRVREYRKSCYPNVELKFRCDSCGCELLTDPGIFIQGEYTCPDCATGGFVPYDRLKLATPLRLPGNLTRRLFRRKPPREGTPVHPHSHHAVPDKDSPVLSV